MFYLNPWGLFIPFVLAAFLHEVGHCIAVSLCGETLETIQIGGTGAEIRTNTLSHGKQLICSFAGPAVNLILFVAFRSFESFAFINLFLAAYNLLPIEPLDGGIMLRTILMIAVPAHQDRLMGGVRWFVLGLFALTALVFCFMLKAGIWMLLLFGILILRLPNENPVAKRRAVP